MLLNVLDATGTTQKVIVKGQEAIVDYSSTITATNTSQIALAANSLRSGFLIQNLGTHNMWINDLSAATEIQGSILLVPNGILTSDDYAVNTNAINIIGTAGDGYTLRAW